MESTSKNRYERPLAMAMTLQKKDKNRLANAKEVVEKTLISHFNTQSRQILKDAQNSFKKIKVEKSS